MHIYKPHTLYERTLGSFFSAALLLLCVCKCVPFILSTVQENLHETMLESVRPILLIIYMYIGRDDHCKVLFPRSVLHYVHHCTLILQSSQMCVYVSQGFSQYTECVHGLVPGLVPHSLLLAPQPSRPPVRMVHQKRTPRPHSRAWTQFLCQI